jgi:hypothetical protein
MIAVKPYSQLILKSVSLKKEQFYGLEDYLRIIA